MTKRKKKTTTKRKGVWTLIYHDAKSRCVEMLRISATDADEAEGKAQEYMHRNGFNYDENPHWGLHPGEWSVNHLAVVPT